MSAALKHISYGKYYGAIEAFSQEGQTHYAWTVVKRSKGELDIRHTGIAVNSEILKRELAGHPVVLCINTRQVIQKEVEDTDASDNKLLHKAFPNVKLEDFHFEVWRRESSALVAICRRSHTDELLEQIGKGLHVIAIHLGVAPVAVLQPFGLPARLHTTCQLMLTSLPGDLVQPLQGEGLPAEINGLTVPAQSTIGFAAIVALSSGFATSGNVRSESHALEERYQQDSFFRKILIAAVFMLLVLLLVNFLFFSYYFDKANALTEKVEVDKVGLQGVVRLKERVREKEALLRGFSTKAGNASEVVNELVKDVPASVLLSQLEYHPLEHKLREGEAMAVSDSLIIITGQVKNIADFNAWIEKKQAVKGVAGITIGNFGSDEEGNTVFTIKIRQR